MMNHHGWIASSVLMAARHKPASGGDRAPGTTAQAAAGPSRIGANCRMKVTH
jgi:hypothetical protein